jgi:hypothetical protein
LIRPEIVVLCGSTKFPDAFTEASRRLGLAGIIVLSVSMFGHAGDLTEEECTIGHPIKDSLDELHKRKIDLADRVLVLNVGGYIGESTRGEVEYAQAHGKRIDYLEPVWTLSEACQEVVADLEIRADYPEGLMAKDILFEIRVKHGPDAFPLVSIIDVCDEMEALYA